MPRQEQEALTPVCHFRVQLRQKYNTRFSPKINIFQALGLNQRALEFPMMPVLPRILPFIILLAVQILDATTAAPAQDQPSLDFENCKIIAADQARLDCLKKLLPKPPTGPAAAEADSSAWPLVRTPRPNGGPDAVAIMRTADVTQSDPDLAGLMIRCQDKPGFEVVLAMVRPFAPRSKKDVVVTLGTAQSVLKAETALPGTALTLPIDATAFTTGPFKGAGQLSVKISDPEGDIRGVIPLDGITSALAKLSANCPSK